MVAEDLLDGQRLRFVVELRRRPVGVDVSHVLGPDARVGDGPPHDPDRAASVRRRGRDMERVGGRSVAQDFGIDPRAPGQGAPEILEDDDAGPFAHDEPVPLGVERPGRPGRVGVVLGQRLQGVESGDAQGRDRRFGPPGDHDVRVPPGDHPEGIADGVRSGAAGGDRGRVRPERLVFDRDLARGLVDDRLDQEERRNPVGPLFHQDAVRILERSDPPDARSDADARLLPFEFGGRQARILDGELGGGDGVLDEEVHLPSLFFFDEGAGIEILDLAGEPGGEAGGVEPGDRPDAAGAAQQALPGRTGSDAERGDQADAGDHDPPPGVPGRFQGRINHQATARALLGNVADDVIHGLADGGELLRFVVRDIQAEFILEGHHELDGVQGVGPEIVDEGRSFRNLVFADAELVRDDGSDFLEQVFSFHDFLLL